MCQKKNLRLEQPFAPIAAATNFVFESTLHKNKRRLTDEAASPELIYGQGDRRALCGVARRTRDRNRVTSRGSATGATRPSAPAVTAASSSASGHEEKSGYHRHDHEEAEYFLPSRARGGKAHSDK
jgi:hypothetical protein